MHVFRRIGIKIQTKDIFDTMIASFLCDENLSKGLKEQSMYRMGLNQTHFKEATATVPNEVKKQFGYKSNSKVTFDLVKISDAAPYALADSFNTYMLSLGFRKELEDEKMDKIYWNMYAPFIYTLLEMEEKGVTVDMPELEEMGVEMQKDLEDLTYKIYELAGCEFNINSSQQKAELLFGYKKDNKPFTQTDYEKLPKIAKEVIEKAKHKSITVAKANAELAKRNIWIDPNNGKMWKTPKSEVDFGDKSFKFKVLATTESGSPSTDSDTIWRLSNLTFKNKRKQQGADMCKYLLQYSELNKLKTAFVDGLKEQVYDDGKAHPSFNIGGASSGRLSCQSPNLQQLPNANDDDKYQIRALFIGSPYYKNKETGELRDDISDLPKKERIKWRKKRKKIFTIDYHNLEMVCLTYFSHDKNLSTMFANDDDAHGSTAVNMFNLPCEPKEAKKKYPHLRQAAKTINFLNQKAGSINLSHIG